MEGSNSQEIGDVIYGCPLELCTKAAAGKKIKIQLVMGHPSHRS